MANPIESISFCDGFAVTKSDTAVFMNMASALYIGGTGDVVVRTQKGSTLTFKAVPAGATLKIRCDQVKSTGTTATDIVALTY